ncbi:MAG: tripartite tricarboxylate transporter substrate binding protein [Alphaproteobacteria bacterium]|nr:tripartite tricarboxylate transporter substrate binding protein [Alphaproteobacteria bacterium]
MFKISLLAASAVIVSALAQPCWAQSYPSQNVTVLVSFPAGGLADMIARLVSTKIEANLKHSFVTENRAGAGGNIAAKAVAGAAPDGYTLLVTTSGLAANMTASKNKGFEQGDLRPIAFVAFSPDVIAVHPSNPAKNLKEFVANAKEKSFTYGSAGVGTGPHIGGEYFFQEVAKVKYVHVPFQGGTPAITATLGNHVDALVLTLPPTTPHIRSGALRGMGVASDKRNTATPDVPTYGEMGYPNVFSGSWVAFFPRRPTPSSRSSTPRSTR